MLARGVAYTTRSVGLSGIGWLVCGIHRRLDGSISNFSGKPTFWECPFKGRLGGGYRPEADNQTRNSR